MACQVDRPKWTTLSFFLKRYLGDDGCAGLVERDKEVHDRCVWQRAHPEGCAAPRFVLVTVPRISRSREHSEPTFSWSPSSRCVGRGRCSRSCTFSPITTSLLAAVASECLIPRPSRRWRSNPSGKCPQERLIRGTVTSTMRRAAHPSGCARCGRSKMKCKSLCLS